MRTAIAPGSAPARIRRATLVLLAAAVALLALAAGARAEGVPAPAWKVLAATGPTHLPPRQSEVQRVTIGAEGGTFTLAPITVQGAGTLTTASKVVTAVSTTVGSFQVGDAITGNGIPAGTTVTAAGAGTVTLSAFPTIAGSNVALTGGELTGSIAYNAPAITVQGALEELAVSEPGLFTVTGGPGGDGEHPYFIAFGGALANKDIAQIIVAGTGLGATGYINAFTTVPGGPGSGEIAIFPTNVGGGATKGEITVELGPLPSGIVTSGPAAGTEASAWSCPNSSGVSTVKCTLAEGISALAPTPSIRVPIEVQFAFATFTSVPVTVSGGGAAPAAYQLPIVVSTQGAPAGISAFFSGIFDAAGRPATQAGGHPNAQVTAFHVNTVRTTFGKVVPSGDIKDVNVDLQPGFVGNPLVTARCPQGLPAPRTDKNQPAPACNEAEADKFAVGRLYPGVANFASFGAKGGNAPFFNDVPVAGAAAEFSSKVAIPVATLVGNLRSEEDFGIRVRAINNAIFKGVFYVDTVFFGQPPGAGGRSFFRNATDCAEQARQAPVQSFEASTWQEPARFARVLETLPPVTGCEKLSFAPQFSFQPSTTKGSSGAGATARLHIDQSALTDPNRLATPDLKQSVVTLPEGVNVNPSQAAGLEACSEAQVGFVGFGAPPNRTRFNNDPVACPDGSKLGTAEVTTPLLDQPLKGTIYLAEQEKNPFGSLIGLYLVFESPRFGITLKLPGKVENDPQTGQVTATFDDVPQAPTEDLTLNFRGGGPRSEFATPEVCGTYTTTGSWTPWSAPESGPPAQTSDSFTVSENCSSSAGARPFHPSFEAGTVDPAAGSYSPLVIKINRADGEQELSRLDFTFPLGLIGKPAGIPFCSEAAIADAAGKRGREEQAHPSCPSGSQLGTVDTAAGVGSEPFHAPGKIYWAGPYKGAPFSAVVVVPAVAGPFDLGTVVVRTPISVNLETAQVSAKSDPLPTILRGIPLKVRSVLVKLDRPNFVLNPTNCEPQSFKADLGGSSGATATPSNRFQVGGCEKLKYKPRLKLRLKGATKRSGHPALRAIVTAPQGAFANTARIQVGLPHSEFLDQGNLDKVCTQPQLKSQTCPARSVYGHVKVWTPLFDEPLEGNVYIGVGYGHKLPDLVTELNGQVRLLVHGKVDTTKHEGLRNTFEFVPDAPFSKILFELKGGKKYGLLENSENLCKKKQRASARFVAQNGLVSQLHPKIANQCGKKKHKKHKKHKQGGKKRGSKGGKGK